jgi:hypothetical protein
MLEFSFVPGCSVDSIRRACGTLVVQARLRRSSGRCPDYRCCRRACTATIVAARLTCQLQGGPLFSILKGQALCLQQRCVPQTHLQ